MECDRLSDLGKLTVIPKPALHFRPVFAAKGLIHNRPQFGYDFGRGSLEVRELVVAFQKFVLRHSEPVIGEQLVLNDIFVRPDEGKHCADIIFAIVYTGYEWSAGNEFLVGPLLVSVLQIVQNPFAAFSGMRSIICRASPMNCLQELRWIYDRRDIQEA